jgi:hypothetical protein
VKLFDRADYNHLASLFTLPGYKGYKPEVLEAPNGDGKIDVQKRYLHVALKYNPPQWALYFLARAHFEACRIAEAIGCPEAYYPKVENGTLRVLDYPPEAGSAEHTDFDLFTVHCYRSTPRDFVKVESPAECYALQAGARRGAYVIDPDAHFGEIGEAVGLGPATKHYVPGREYSQQAIVYFAMPANNAVMPNGTTAINWIAERCNRSRVYK